MTMETRIRNLPKGRNVYELTEEEKRHLEHVNSVPPKKRKPKCDWHLGDPNRKLRPGEKEWLKIPEEDRPGIGDEYKGVAIRSFDKYGYPEGVNGRNLVFGYVTTGNKFGGGGGRPKGSRNKLTTEMLQMIERQQVSPAEFLATVIHNPEYSLDNQIKAAMKLTDIVYPKASSVELDVINEEPESMEDIDARIKEALEHMSARFTKPEED